LRVDPKHFWAHFTLGICLDQIGRHAESVRIYTTAIALWPEFPWSYVNRGLVHSQLGNWHVAIEDYSFAIQQDETCAEAYVNRGVAYLKLHQYRHAVADLSAAIGLGQNKASTWAARAASYAGLDDLAAALRDYETALEESPGNVSVRISRGFALARQDPQAALADFDYVAQRHPQLAQGHYGRAAVLSRIPGETESAIQAARQALAVDPTHTDARAALALLLARARQFDEALAEAYLILKEKPSGPTTYTAACAYALAAECDVQYATKAFELLGKALDQDFGRKEIPGDADLDALRNDPRFAEIMRRCAENP